MGDKEIKAPIFYPLKIIENINGNILHAMKKSSEFYNGLVKPISPQYIKEALKVGKNTPK